jgi:hypothetical protein
MIWRGDMLFGSVAGFPKCSLHFLPHMPDAFYRNRRHCQHMWAEVLGKGCGPQLLPLRAMRGQLT